MPKLTFKIKDVGSELFAATPTLLFGLQIDTDRAVENITLNCQIRIEPGHRGYEAHEHDTLSELFGEKRRWGQTLRSFMWDNLTLPIPAFERTRAVKIPVACSYDFNVAATKYFHGLANGEVPLIFLFSGSVFYNDDEDRLQIAQVSWTQAGRFALPVTVWKDLMDRYYPDTIWLQVRHDLFERLNRYRRENGFNDWDAAFENLIPQSSAKSVGERVLTGSDS